MKRIRIFISSVQSEFAEERAMLSQYVRTDALLGKFFETFIFEDVPANEASLQQVYLSEVEMADIYLGLYGNKYGYEDEDGVSPIFKQFCDLKKKHPDALLLFRCGDSYKCYEEDAIKAAEILRLTDIVEDDKITVASFPYHALDTYLPRLIRAGHRIAICDQLEAPKPKKQAQMELFLRS